MKCAEPPADEATPLMDFTYYRLSLTLCREICLGQDHDYAVIQADRCRCYDFSTVSALASVPLSSCDTPCATNKYQGCGGASHVMVLHSGTFHA